MIVIPAMLVPLSRARVATAQTVASLKIIAGDGQVACLCIEASLQYFQPITVQALDAGGNGVANATITWTVTSGQASVGSPTTKTDSNGMSSNPLNLTVLAIYGTLVQPYLPSTIVAAANTGTPATFYETYSLIDQHGNPMVSAGFPTMNGQLLGATALSGNSGSTLPSIQVFVGGEGLAGTGVPNVSIQLVPYPGQTSPTIACAPSSLTGNPGAVLSGTVVSGNPAANATCSPVLGGSGTGQFYVMVGGVVTSTVSGIAGGPLYLQEYGPYTFTAIPGLPAAINLIQGNNQALAPGQSLGQLIAQVVDARGNAVQGANVNWSPNPAAAVALTNTIYTTDNNGQVSTVANFSGVAAGNVNITVSLVGNSAINNTFTETAVVPIKSLQKIAGGDGQSAVAGTAFAKPLVVQVNGANSPLTNYPVQFSISGPGILSANTAATNNSGQAQVTVTRSEERRVGK